MFLICYQNASKCTVKCFPRESDIFSVLSSRKVNIPGELLTEVTCNLWSYLHLGGGFFARLFVFLFACFVFFMSRFSRSHVAISPPFVSPSCFVCLQRDAWNYFRILQFWIGTNSVSAALRRERCVWPTHSRRHCGSWTRAGPNGDSRHPACRPAPLPPDPRLPTRCKRPSPLQHCFQFDLS